MTHEQRSQILDKIAEIVGEHCESYIFMAQVPTDEPDEDGATISSWDGNINTVMGLSERMRQRMKRRIKELERPPKDES